MSTESSNQKKEDGATSQKVIHILALHGKYGNGPSFQTFLEPLTSSLQKQCSIIMNNVTFEWDYLTAPFPLSDNNNKEEGFQWWKLPPNTRSFTAKEYIGYNVSQQMIIDALSSSEKKYHIVLGHSQGAILLSAFLATFPHDMLLNDDDDDDDTTATTTTKECSDNGTTQRQQQQIESPPMAYIFNGAAWPNPFTNQLQSLSSTLSVLSSSSSTTTSAAAAPPDKKKKKKKKKKALFIIGKRDKMNPPEGAEQVKQSFEQTSGVLDVHTCYHDGGHSVPVANEDAVNEIVSWILNVVQEEE